MDYPIFRKNSSGISVYTIISDSEFIEKQRIGQNILEHTVKAAQYPEMLLIQDLIDCKAGTFEEITEEDYISF